MREKKEKERDVPSLKYSKKNTPRTLGETRGPDGGGEDAYFDKNTDQPQHERKSKTHMPADRGLE